MKIFLQFFLDFSDHLKNQASLMYKIAHEALHVGTKCHCTLIPDNFTLPREFSMQVHFFLATWSQVHRIFKEASYYTGEFELIAQVNWNSQ